MKKIIFFIIYLFVQAVADTPSADSMKALPATLKGKERLVALLDLANNIESKSPQGALAYSAEGLSLSKQEGDKEYEAAFLSSTAFCYTQTGDLPLAIKYGLEALGLSRQIGNKERMAKAHNALGIAYTYMGSYSQALEEHLEALRIREELALDNALIISLNNIGSMYHHSGQYDKAIDYYQQILRRLENKPDSARLIQTKLNIGFAKYKQGQLAEALKNHQEALELSLKRKDTPLLGYTHFNLGITYTDLKQFDKALFYLRLSLAEIEKQEQKHARVQVLNALGRLYFATGDYTNAILITKEGATLAEKINARDELKSSYELISEAYGKQKNITESYRYFKLFATIKDSIYTIYETNKIADISMKIVTMKKDNEIESLKKEQVISSLKIEKGRYLSIILVSSIVFLISIIYILVRYNKKIRYNKKLLEKNNTELEVLNTKLFEKINLINTLSGLLPICAQCKKIRNDKGYWEQLEGYISAHTSATFSHGICPGCAEVLYPDALKEFQAQHDHPT